MERLKKFLEERNLSGDIEKILEFQKEHIEIKLIRREDYTKLGNSRIGGVPDLPKGMEWPETEDGEYMNFIMQINLEEIPYAMELGLPFVGMVYVFMGDDENAGQIENKVFYSFNKPLKRAREVKDFVGEREEVYPGYRVEFKRGFSVNSDKLDDLYKGETLDELMDLLYDYKGRNIILGVEELWNGDISEDAYFTQGRYRDLKYYHHHSLERLDKKIDEALKDGQAEYADYLDKKVKPELEDFQLNKGNRLDEMKKWKLLFKVASNEECDMCFWDAGYLEIAIEADRLKNLDFRNTYGRIATS